MGGHISNVRPKPDKVLVDIADYVLNYKVKSKEAFDTARYCLMDTLGCGFEALSYPACTKLMGPIVPGTIVPNGAKVPGTSFQLDPVMAAFNIGCMIRWLDFNDAFYGRTVIHPSDNIGAILKAGGSAVSVVMSWIGGTAFACPSRMSGGAAATSEKCPVLRAMSMTTGHARLILLLPYIMTKNIWVSTGAHILNDWTLFIIALLGAIAPGH